MKSNLFHSLICIVSIFACYIASTVKASAETNLEVLATGSCGDNVTYTIYSDYSMVISGTGAMWNYSSDNHIDNDYYSRIKKVIIEDGVTSICDYAFHNFFGLTSVTIPNSVTSIGGNAFYRCFRLTSVDIPNSVTSIGNSAFSGCTGLTSVDIPDSVTSIGEYAFSSCTGLTSVTIPNSVTSIGYGAFNGCSGLISVTIPNSVTSISGNAFYGCTGLTSVTIPNSVTSIGYGAFNGCSGLISVTIPNSVTSISGNAFYGCTGLTSVTIPNSVTSIGNSAFSGCTGLTSVTIPSGVISIGKAAFYGCSGLTSVNIPNSVLSIGHGAFYRCYSLASITVESGNTMYDSRDNCNAIIEKRTNWLIAGCKTTVIPNSVTDIGIDAFGYCSGLTSVTIPNSVTSIGHSAFSGCTGLTSVTIPNSVISISYSAFSDCTGLTSVTIPNSVTSLESGVFSGCTGLTTITMESDVPLSIDRTSFSNVDKTTCILYVPYGSKSAYENAQYWSEFQNIVELEDGGETKPSTYTDSQGVNYQLINNGAAYKVTGHTDDFNHNLTIPASLYGLPVIEIGSDALGWSNLESVVLPEGIEIIGMNAISDCNITSLVIPASVNSLYPSDDNAFSNDRLLSSIRVEEGNEVYDSRDNCNAIIETATNRLVSGCMNTVIPQSVTSIGRDAFYASQFSSITLPAGITSIGEIAFTSCDKLNAIYAMMTTPASVVNGAFENYHYSNVTLYVPKGSKTLYEQADVWRNFQNIVEFEEGGSTEPEDGVLQPDGTTTWTTFQGVKMTFKVIDAEKKWVQVGNGVDPSISQSTTGEVTIPNEIVIDGETYTVVGIGDYGFYNCDKLTAIWLPDNLQFIGKYAFYGCKLVGKIQIPETVYAIDDTAFEGCTGLTEISCPYIPGFSYPSVPIKIIGYKPSDEDFDVVIPQPVTSIGERAFSYCANIRTMRVEEGNTVFDSRDNCNAIIRTADNVLLFGCKSTVIPSSVTAIDAYAFEGHTGLSTIAIPASVASIGQGAFADCTSMTTVTSNIQNPYAINDNTFSTTTYETATLKVPHGTKSAYQAADGWKNFLNIVEMEEVVSDDPIIFADAEVKRICVENWDTNGDGELSYSEAAAVTELGTVFKDNNVITSFDELQYFIGLVEIGETAFSSCSEMTSIVLPQQITSIGSSAFLWCSKLASIRIPKNVTNIESSFAYCRSLSSIIVESGNTKFDSRDNCNAIIETATNTLFVGCMNTIIPDGVKYIRKFAFEGHSGLKTINIPSSVKSIYYTAFRECSGLDYITVDSDNTTYDSRDNCNAVIEKYSNRLIVGSNNTIIPNSVTVIGSEAFRGREQLNLSTLPDNVTAIENCAFYRCIGIESMELPNSVTSIGYAAFEACLNMKSVVLPSSITSISDRAFGQSRMNSLTIKLVEPLPIAANTFENRSRTTLYVPKGSKSAYENAEYWNEFKNIVEMDEITLDDPIIFTDAEVKRICVENWDTSGDGELSYSEAAAVTELGTVFKDNSVITSFDELQYFTGLASINKDAFSNCTELSSVKIPNGVTSIEWYAFSNCDHLATVEIPNSVTIIYSLAFADCDGLTSITIPSSVTEIYFQQPFSNCPNLSSIEVDPNNDNFDSRNDCNAIIHTSTNSLVAGCKNTVIPNSVTSISREAFIYCTNLTTMNIPDGVTFIDFRAFCGCSKLQSVSIPGSVTYIGEAAFRECRALVNVTIPKNVTTIGNTAFGECTGLVSVTVENSVPIAIQSYTFNNVNKSTCTLYVPKGSKSAYENAEYWNEFKNIVEMDEITLDDPIIFADAEVKRICVENWDTSRDGELSYREAAAVTELGETFKGTNIEFFDELQYFTGLTIIGDDAFKKCNNLMKILIPENVTTIGRFAFYDCSGLSSFIIPNSVNVIDYESFGNCSSLTSIIIPNSVTTIGTSAFYGCSSLTSITIPYNVKSIGISAFSRCSRLESISVDQGNEIYDSREGCNAIVETLSNKLLAGCKNSVIPNSVTTIAPYAFAGCSGLTSIVISSNVSSIGNGAFEFCPDISSICVDEDNPVFDSRNNCNAIIKTSSNVLVAGCKNTVIPNDVITLWDFAFSGCSGLTSIVIPSSVSTIGWASFSSCKGLVSIEIPNSVTSIDNWAFSLCSSLSSVTIPSSVASIGNYAFNSCTGLNSITLENTIPLSVSAETFNNVNKSTCTLYVPYGSRSAYENAEYWNEFENIVEIGEEPDTDISALANAIYVERTEGLVGGTTDISIRLKSNYDVCAFMFKMLLPEGVTINSWTLSDELGSDLTTNDYEFKVDKTGTRTSVLFTLAANVPSFKYRDCEAVRFSVTFGEDMDPGNYPIYLTECTTTYIITNEAGISVIDNDLSDVKATLVLEDYKIGDANGDGKLRIGDATTILIYLSGTELSNFNAKAADANRDGKLRIGDVTTVLYMLADPE